MYSRSPSRTHKIRYRKILRGHHDVGVCFIQDMWGKAMHMHRAADLVSGEPVWLKLPAACYADKKWIFVPDFPASRQ